MQNVISMSFYVVLDSRTCSGWEQSVGQLTAKLPYSLYVDSVANWHLALIEYSVHPKEPTVAGRPWLILADILEPQIFNDQEKPILFSGPILRRTEITSPLFKKLKSGVIDRISLEFVNTQMEPINYAKNQILLTLAFRKL